MGQSETAPGGTVRHALTLVRDTIPPLHPGGRPVIAAVAAAAFGLRALRGRGTFAALARADCLLVVDEATTHLEAGETVEVWLLDG